MFALKGSRSISSRGQAGRSDHGGALELNIGGDVRAVFGLSAVGVKAEWGLKVAFVVVSGVGTRDGG